MPCHIYRLMIIKFDLPVVELKISTLFRVMCGFAISESGAPWNAFINGEVRSRRWYSPNSLGKCFNAVNVTQGVRYESIWLCFAACLFYFLTFFYQTLSMTLFPTMFSEFLH